MEKQIKSADVVEALEQVRASFTVSRMAFGAITLLFPLRKKDQKWVKKFQDIQSEYHTFLLDSYNELNAEYERLYAEENPDEKKEDKKDDVDDFLLNHEFTAEDVKDIK